MNFLENPLTFKFKGFNLSSDPQDFSSMAAEKQDSQPKKKHVNSDFKRKRSFYCQVYANKRCHICKETKEKEDGCQLHLILVHGRIGAEEAT